MRGEPQSGDGSEESYQYDKKYWGFRIYWFSYEPIVWDIVTEKNGKALMVSKMAIDNQEFHSKKAYVVAEARKLNSDGNYNYTTLDTLSGLITDRKPSDDICRAAEKYGVQIILP